MSIPTTTFHNQTVRHGSVGEVTRTREGHLVLGDLVVAADADPVELRREALAEKDDDVAARLRTIAAVIDEDRTAALRADLAARYGIPTTSVRPPALLVQRDDDGAILVDARVYGRDAEKARTRATYVLDEPQPETTDPEVDEARRVIAFLDSIEHTREHAEQVGAPVTGLAPAMPARPRVCLRTEVEVDGLPVVDIGFYIYPSATDAAHAATTAARALHDAALAALHVLVVEPADPAGGASA